MTEFGMYQRYLAIIDCMTQYETVPLSYWHLWQKKIAHQKIPLLFLCFSTPDWSTPRLHSEGVGSFIDSGLDNLFCLSVNCDVDSIFTVSAGFAGGLSRLLRKQMSTLQRLICLIRLAALSIPVFIYLFTYLFTYSFIYFPLYGFGLISFPRTHDHPLLFLSLSSSLAPISKISLQRRGDNIH